MTWQYESGNAVPADWIQLGQAQFRNIFYLGETLTFPVSGSPSSVASWEVIDHTGLTVASGGSFVPGSTWTLATTLPTGWYRVLFRRAAPIAGWGTSQGGGMFVITRTVAGMPPRPPANSPQSGHDSATDTTLNAFTLTGPVRLDTKVDDATAQEVSNDAAVAQLNTYYYPYDTARAKPSLMAWPYGTDDANAAANIAHVVTHFPNITHFEGTNEPNGVPDASFAPIQQRFYNNIKAARSSAQVCGPCPVSIGGGAVGNIRAFLNAGGGQWIDTWSFHTYNAHMGDLPTGRRSWDAWKALLTEFGQWTKPRMNTEAASFFGAEYGAGQVARQAHRTMLDLFLNDEYGVPKESWSIFYTSSHGFWDYPSFIETGTPASFGTVATLLTHSQELLGTTREATLDFGTIDNNTLIGGRYRRADGSGVVAMLSAGRSAAPVALQISGGSPTTLLTVDGYGRETSVPVSGRLANVTVGTYGLYVRLPIGVTATPVDGATRWGALRSSGATATVTGGSKGITSLNQVLNGPWQNKLYFDAGNVADGVSVWQSNNTPTSASPVDVTVNLPAATYVDTVLIHCPPAWQGALSVIRDADVQVLGDAGWVTVGTFGYQPRVEQVGSTTVEGVNGFIEVWDRDEHVFEVRFPRISATAVRVRVRDVSAGGAPTVEAFQGFGATGVTAGFGTTQPTVALQRLAVYDSAPTAGTGKYVIHTP